MNALSTHVEQATILIVDDNADNLTVLGEMLQPDYRVRVASSGQRTLQIAETTPIPDLILLDIMMPGLDGYGVLEALKRNPATGDIPVIFVTARDGLDDEEAGFWLGAVDYITKPLKPSLVKARVNAQMELKMTRDALKRQNAYLEEEVARRLHDNQIIQEVSIRALARLAEIRDPETGNHILRTQSYIRVLAKKLQSHPRFLNCLTDHYIDLLVKSAPLHDIGKVGIPDHILLKPGKLTATEWEIMKTHTVLGSEAIERAEADAERPVEFLRIAKEIAHWHHEKWDGQGYPDGKKADEIPVSARLMALADVFDALTSTRVYKPAMPFEEARAIISSERGRHFDPDVVDAFLETIKDFKAIALRYQDP